MRPMGVHVGSALNRAAACLVLYGIRYSMTGSMEAAEEEVGPAQKEAALRNRTAPWRRFALRLTHDPQVAGYVVQQLLRAWRDPGLAEIAATAWLFTVTRHIVSLRGQRRRPPRGRAGREAGRPGR